MRERDKERKSVRMCLGECEEGIDKERERESKYESEQQREIE